MEALQFQARGKERGKGKRREAGGQDAL